MTQESFRLTTSNERKHMMKSRLTILAAFGLFGGLMPAAQASLVFTLNQSASFGSGPFGTITLDQTSANLVTVTESLAAGVNFAGTGAGEALEFNIAGDPAIIINVLKAGFE